MANKPRLMESMSSDFTRFMHDLQQHFWSDGELDARERELLVRGERKKERMHHINATDALIEHLKRRELDDEFTYYGSTLAAEAKLHITKLDDYRGAPEKIVAFPKRKTTPTG